MKVSEAIRIALQELRRARRALAFDANVHDRYGATYLTAVKASRRRKKIVEAIATLEQERQADA